jgi:hypothetical protein
MAASSSVLGCLKTGALAGRFVFPASPLAENFRGARDVACLLCSIRINSRVAGPADAAISRSRLGRRFLFPRRALFWVAWRFTGIAVLPSLKIDQGDHSAIDFVRWYGKGALWQSAVVMRIEMLHNNKRHSRLRRQMAQQFHCRLKSSCRAADAYNRAVYGYAWGRTAFARTSRRGGRHSAPPHPRLFCFGFRRHAFQTMPHVHKLSWTNFDHAFAPERI